MNFFLLSTVLWACMLQNSACAQTILWSNSFDTPSTWVLNNSGQTASNFGWNINSTSQGWWSILGISDTGGSGGNNAELSNGNALTGDLAFDVTYTMTTAQPIDIVSLGGSNQVSLTFRQYGARFNDLQEIQMSTDGSTWITIGDNLDKTVLSASGGSEYPNPDIKTINLGSFLSTNPAPIYIRFSWTTNYPSSGTNPNVWITYGWYIDDVKIVTNPPNDLSVTSSTWGSVGLNYYQIPLTQIAPIDFSAKVFNGGVNNQANVVYTASSGTYSGTSNPLNITSLDTATLEITTPFTPASIIGNVVVTSAITTNSIDDLPSNNAISNISFAITDYIYARDKGTTAANSYAGSQSNGTDGYEAGNLFDIFQNQTCKAINVRLLGGTTGTVVGTEIYAKLYEIDDVAGDFAYITESDVLIVATANLDTNLVMELNDLVNLEAGKRYLAVVGAFGAGLKISNAGISEPQTSFFLDLSDGTWYYTTSTPVVRLNFNPSLLSPTSAILSGTTTTCSGASTNLSVAVSGGVPPYTVTVTNGTNTYTATGASPVSIPVSPTITSTYTIVSVTGGGTGTGNTGAATVTIIPSSTNTTTASACGSYTWNGQTYSSSGVYTGATTNCVTQFLNLTITPSSTNTTSASACGSYVWNGTTYTSSGVYTGTTTNCVTEFLNLTITPSSTNTTTASACNSYVWNGTTYTTSGVYTGTTTNCVTQSLNLTITPSSANTTAATACDSYTWNGQTYTQSGVYTGATANCVTQFLNLSITPSSTITQPASQSISIGNNAQFIVGSSGSNAIYQWQTDLGIGFQNLNSVGQYSGTSNNILTVSNVTFSNNNQPFRCIVSSGSCTDTSDVAVLTVVNNVGFNDLSASKLSIYPNPTNGDFTITGLELLGTVSSLTLTDMNGKVVKVLDTKATKFSMASIKPGVYFLNILSENKLQVLKIVKE